ncbi:protein of unknown function [Vibrio tapetis subsp. tapetis]|uniref:Uncharacterized protein n=1 Tax=Vibrio tapetis subsp. tapetis TaxID=1671868 RepID=A0A2N8ZNK3_9VIBR|nr:protein of unknown function [Vibrio tapetis subsp. tapetis]
MIQRNIARDHIIIGGQARLFGLALSGFDGHERGHLLDIKLPKPIWADGETAANGWAVALIDEGLNARYGRGKALWQDAAYHQGDTGALALFEQLSEGGVWHG